MDVLTPTMTTRLSRSYSNNVDVYRYTIRSMMGDYSGHSSMLEIKAQEHQEGEERRFSYHYSHQGTRFVIIYTITALIVAVIIWLLLILLFVIKVAVQYLYRSYTSRNKVKIS
jgi:hypothetical protein